MAMLTILHELGLHRNADGSLDLEGFKIVYVAPMKALVQEVTANFSNRLEPFGVFLSAASFPAVYPGAMKGVPLANNTLV